MKLEKYGIKMQGLKMAAGETKWLDGRNGYVQISYDHADVNGWTRYHSETIIPVRNTREPMTMQGIADAVALALDA